MTEPPIAVLVAGIPFAYQKPLPGGRWLTNEHIRKITSISPRITLAEASRDELIAGFTPDPTAEVILTETAGFDPLLDITPEAVTAHDFARLITPRLRWVMSCSSGVEHLVPGLDDSVVLTNSSGVHANALAESVMLAILAHAKRLRDRLLLQRQHSWQPLYCTELRGKTLCTLGTGDIALGVARFASTFGMRLVGVRRAPRPAPCFDRVVGRGELHEVLASADYVLIACPLTPETEGMIGAAEFAAMKPGAYFINVARGKIADETALIAVLSSGHLSGAYLDAHVNEPLRADQPFWTMPTVTVIPHDSHSSEWIGENTIDLFCDNLRRYVNGEQLRNVIDKRLGY